MVQRVMALAAVIPRAFWTLLALSVSWNAGRAQTAPWRVETSVGARYFVDAAGDQSTLFNPHLARPVVPSPDGRYFFVITTRGDLARDLNIAELRVYDTARVRSDVLAGRAAPPVHRLVRTSGGNTLPISGASWTRDSGGIIFQGALDTRDDAYLFLGLDVASGRIEALTEPRVVRATAGLVRRDIFDWRGGAVIHRGYVPIPRRPRPSALDYPVSVVTHDSLGSYRPSATPDRATRYYFSRGGVRREIGPDLAILEARLNRAGSRAVILATRGGAARAGAPPPTGPRAALPQFMILDSSGGLTPRPVAVAGAVDPAAPERVRPDALWSPDGRMVLLVNAHPGQDQIDRRGPAQVVAYNLASGRADVLAPVGGPDGDVVQVGWEGDKNVVISFRSPTGITTRRYARTGEGWHTYSGPGPRPVHIAWSQAPSPSCSTAEDRRSGGCASSARYRPPLPLRFANGLELLLREGMNEPQTLQASVGGATVSLIGPDPSLANISIAPSRIVQWRRADGELERGILTLPTGRTTVPRPLVIQVYYFTPHAFRPDGSYSSPYAAQALAARGIAVLSLTLSCFEAPASCMTPAEGRAMVASVDGFVDLLAGQGLIDRNQVGMVGHSRGGYMTYYAATHPGRTRLAAYFISDAITASYSEHVRDAGRVRGDNHGENGGSTFWQDKPAWLEHSPEFNADRIQGAGLFAINSDGLPGYSYAQAQLGIFELTRRPLELVNLPLGQHPLVRPRERFASLTVMIDWMDFWLQGREDPDPAKREQYVRWREMRARWARQQAWEAQGNPAGSAPPAEFRPASNPASPSRAPAE